MLKGLSRQLFSDLYLKNITLASVWGNAIERKKMGGQKPVGKVCRNSGKRGWSQRVRFMLVEIEKDVYIFKRYLWDTVDMVTPFFLVLEIERRGNGVIYYTR